jgi:hypothetical protein
MGRALGQACSQYASSRRRKNEKFDVNNARVARRQSASSRCVTGAAFVEKAGLNADQSEQCYHVGKSLHRPRRAAKEEVRGPDKWCATARDRQAGRSKVNVVLARSPRKST